MFAAGFFVFRFRDPHAAQIRAELSQQEQVGKL
jgi:hypothetical protein